MIQFGTGGWRAVIGDEFIKTNISNNLNSFSIKIFNFIFYSITI